MSSFDGHTNMKWVPKRSNTFLVPSTTTSTTPSSQRDSSPKHFQSNANDRALKNNKTKSFSEWTNHQPQPNRSHSPGHLHPRDPTASSTSYYHYSVKTPTISITHKAIVPVHTQPQKPSPQRSQSSQSFTVTRARSKSDPFRDSVESIVVDYPQTVSTSTSTEAFATENPVIITPRKYNASKPHRNHKKKSHPKMVNSSSQTYVDMATQTSDDEEAEQEETVLQAARLLILNATQKKDSKGKKFGSTRSISFNGPNTLQDNSSENSPARSPIGTPTFKSEHDLMTELNDLEEEIAKMRFKALSLKEQMRWIQHEKEPRPGAPVVDLEHSPSHSASSSPSVVMHSPTMLVSPVAERPVVVRPVASPNVVPTLEFTDSKPATDRCFSPVSVLKPAMLRAIDVKSPDPEKRQELSKTNSRASAFQPSNRPLYSPSSLQKNRMTKSLDSLPDLNASDFAESPLLNSSPAVMRKNSKTINIASLED